VKRPILAALVFASCSPSPAIQHPSSEPAAATASVAQPAAPAPAPSAPLRLELTAIAARGDLRALDASGWQPLTAGSSLTGVTELRAVRRAAMLAIGHGDAAGRLWLRAGTRVQIGQDADGVRLTVLDGRIRIRRGGAELPVRVGDLAIDGDYLIDPAGAVPTAARPELALWSLGLDRSEAGAGVGRMDAPAASGMGASGMGASGAGASGAGASGTIEALELRKVDVRVRTEGDLAITEVDHVFHNPADGRPREGTFRFPVPDGAMLTGMAMEIDGKLVEGEIVERDRARQIYDEVVDSMQDPALLEWEAGNWFKLRVFPIPAGGDKRVVIRYTAPLARTAQGHEYTAQIAIADASPGGTAPGAIGELSVTVDGAQVAHETATAGLDVAVPVAAAPLVMREARKDAIYTAVRIAPDAAMFAPKAAATAPAAAAPAASRVAIVFDTSRSALEGRKLADQLLHGALTELAAADRFVVLASDVAVTPSAAEFQPATADAIGQTERFVAAIEPDGASDLGAALTAAAALHPDAVIYIGDGIPTWGEQKPAALGALADHIGAPIHAALIGKGATTALWGDLAGRTGGRALIVRKPDDAARFALVATHARDIPRLVGAHIAVAGDAQVFPRQAATIFQGDELIALIKTPPGAAPTALTLTGTVDGAPFTRQIALAAAADKHNVAQRFGAELIAQLEATDTDRETIVATSRDYGVLSKFTSLLVLENDEAYRKYNIERKAQQQAAQQAPQITGGDLDTLGARRANLSPEEIQPGDPEVKIPAPADAREVLVSFPFGETKRAVWDPDTDAWMVRFLVDKDTPDGDYYVRVSVTHADGRVQLMRLRYVVDTHAPTIALTATRIAGGYRITAVQTDGGAGRRDADRVEVQLPDGTTLALTQRAWGKFEGVWQTEPLVRPVTLRVVVHDHALNSAAQDLAIAAAPGAATRAIGAAPAAAAGAAR
jgi:hypothetical protein